MSTLSRALPNLTVASGPKRANEPPRCLSATPYITRSHRHITNTNKQTNPSLCLAGTLRQRALWRAPKTLSHARHHQSGTLTLTSPWVRRWANEWRWHRTYGRASLSTPRCISTSIVPTSQRFCFADRAKLVFACSIAISARSKKCFMKCNNVKLQEHAAARCEASAWLERRRFKL